ncbi:hypothetical protein ABZV77_13110 [Streptomyces sp. NPDC004732]|uniref:hypothetical protein n=1 Tax=Streptomyces sp. NPDC004732 TaxID=3154290 RepID=UPI0033ADAE50
MNRSTRLAAAALATSAALLLTACGGSDDNKDGKDDKKSAGADTRSSGSPSGSATPSDTAAGRPKITLPKHFHADFQGWTNSDPKQQAIMNDGRQELLAEYAAIIEGNPGSKAVAYYTREPAGQSARKWIKGFVDDDLVLTGSTTVSKPQVSIADDGSGVLFYCVDESKGSTRNTRTGEVVRTPQDAKARVQYRNRLAKTSQGVWQTRYSETERGGC